MWLFCLSVCFKQEICWLLLKLTQRGHVGRVSRTYIVGIEGDNKEVCYQYFIFLFFEIHGMVRTGTYN